MITKLKSIKELLFVFLVSSIFAAILYYYRVHIIGTYSMQGVNGVLLSLFGIFFGFVLTAYSIFVGLNREISNKLKSTKAYRKINLRFALTLVLLLSASIVGMLNIFISSTYLILLHLLLIGVSTLLIFLLVLYLFLLFRTVK